MFPDLRAKPTLTRIDLALQNDCTYDEAGGKVVAACAAEHATVASDDHALQDPDETTVRRQLKATKVKLELVRQDDNKLRLTLAFDAVVRGRKVKYAFTQTFGALQPRRDAASLGGPNEGCAIAAGGRRSRAVVARTRVRRGDVPFDRLDAESSSPRPESVDMTPAPIASRRVAMPSSTLDRTTSSDFIARSCSRYVAMHACSIANARARTLVPNSVATIQPRLDLHPV